MKRIDFYILLGIIVAGFIVLIYFQNRGKNVQEPDKVTVVVKYDSMPQSATNVIKPAITIKPGELPQNVINILSDTAVIKVLGSKMDVLVEIMERYFEVRTQEVLSYTKDSLHLVDTQDTLTENGIIGRSTFVKCYKPITTITIEKPIPPRNKFFIGGNIEGGPTGLNNIGPEITLLTKKDWLYSVGWNGYKAIQGEPYNFSLSAHWKISLRKKK